VEDGALPSIGKRRRENGYSSESHKFTSAGSTPAPVIWNVNIIGKKKKNIQTM